MTIVVIGYAILLGNDPREKPGVSYFALFLCVAGVAPAIPMTIVWTGNNLSPTLKRGTGMGMSTCCFAFQRFCTSLTASLGLLLLFYLYSVHVRQQRRYHQLARLLYGGYLRFHSVFSAGGQILIPLPFHQTARATTGVTESVSPLPPWPLSYRSS